jgi:hypothetical protein
VQAIQNEFEPVEFRLEGILDVAAAREVLRAVEDAPMEAEIRIDVTHVREFHDFAVAVLAHELAPRADHVALRGLRQHQLRLLTYLGFPRAAEPLDVSDSAMA